MLSNFKIGNSSDTISNYSLQLNSDGPAFCPSTDRWFIYYNYMAFQCNVSVSGFYSIVSFSDLDTIGYMYNGSFNPLKPSQNLVLSDDNSGGNRQFKLKASLPANYTLVLVASTYYWGAIGSMVISGSGPSLMTCSPLFITSKN